MQAAFQALFVPSDHYPRCTWPLNVVSPTRDLDVSQCFEHAVVLPLPSILAMIIVLYRFIVIKRGLSRGKIQCQDRPRDSRRLCTAKVVSCLCGLFGYGLISRPY
jgi:ATP-binding cassette subfamily C (CFTR/MRP) protein 1